MPKHVDWLEITTLLSEDKAKELLAEILYSYSAIGTVDHDMDKFINDVKRIYLDLRLDR